MKKVLAFLKKIVYNNIRACEKRSKYGKLSKAWTSASSSVGRAPDS